MVKWFKLLKFIIKTRISPGMLAILLIIIIYAIFTGIGMSSSGIKINTKVPQYYAVIYATFFLVFSSFSGGLAILKSDRDYLFLLPVNKRQLIVTLFIAQIIILGSSIIAFLGFYLPFLGLNAWEAVTSFALFILFVTSLSTYVGDLPTGRKAIISTLLGAWGISPLLSFPYSPTAIFFGYPLSGIFVLVPSTIVTMIFSNKKIANIGIEYFKTVNKSSSVGFKGNISFAGHKGIKALYYFNINYLTIAGRSGGIGYNVRYFSGRVKITKILLVISIVSAVYAFITIKYLSTNANLISLLTSIFAVSFIYSFMQASIANERPWLAFTSIDPGSFLIHLSISKAISSIIILLPLVISDAIIGLVVSRAGPSPISQVTLLIAMPSILVISNYVATRYSLVPQIREEGVLPGQMRIKQFFFAIPMYIIFAVIGISAFSFFGGLVSSGILCLIAVIMLTNKRIWRKAAYSMIDHGYV
ncbi:MAG: hypothetical protein F7B11_03130 [Caldisphaeraceae archaeon]|nr:hypothetical protein [Caldisphaeraceae archaeon]